LGHLKQGVKLFHFFILIPSPSPFPASKAGVREKITESFSSSSLFDG